MKALVVSIVIFGIGGVIVTYMIGYSVFEGTVTESPYETGLKWDETNRQKSELGWTVTDEIQNLMPGVNEFIFSLKDKGMNTLEPDSIDILVTRPVTSRFDKHYTPQKHDKGRYRVMIDFPEYGYWDIVFTVKKGEQLVMLKESVYVNKK